MPAPSCGCRSSVRICRSESGSERGTPQSARGCRRWRARRAVSGERRGPAIRTAGDSARDFVSLDSGHIPRSARFEETTVGSRPRLVADSVFSIPDAISYYSGFPPRVDAFGSVRRKSVAIRAFLPGGAPQERCNLDFSPWERGRPARNAGEAGIWDVS